MPNSLTQNQQKCFVEWLGIPELECPPSWYKLLGLKRSESDPEAIKEALFQRLNKISLAASDADRAIADEAKNLLRQTAAALLEPDTKATYDAKLRASEQQKAAPVTPTNVSPVPPPVPASADTIQASEATAAVSTGMPVWATALLVANLVLITAIGGFLLFKQGANGNSVSPPPTPPGGSQASGGEPSGVDEEPSKGSAAGIAETRSEEEDPAEVIEDSADEDASAPEPQQQEDLIATADEQSVIAGKGLDAPSEEVEPEDPNPLSKLVEAATLPPIGEFGNNSNRSIDLGQLGSNATDQLKVALDEGATDLGRETKLTLRPSESLPGNWELVQADYASGAAQGEPLARLFVDDESRLRLAWFMIGNRRTAAMQVANTALLLSVGDFSHRLQLREPVGMEYAAPFLVDEKIEVLFDPIEAMPRTSRLKLEITGVPDYKYPLSVSEYTSVGKQDRDGNEILGTLTMTLGQFQQVLVSASLVKTPEGRVGLFLEPAYKQAKSKKGRTKPLTVESLGSEVRKQQRFASKNYRTFVTAVQREPVVRAALGKANRLAQQLFAAGNPDAAGAQTEANRLSSEHQSLVRTIKSARSNLPKSYNILAHYYSVARLARALHDSVGIEYRLYIEGRQGDIDLLVGDGQLRVRGPRFPANLQSGVSGDWIRLAPSVVYRFAPGRLTLLNPAGAARNGTWQRQERRVDLSYGGANETYELIEDVILRGQTANLYRAF